jgi:hypothetical protein
MDSLGNIDKLDNSVGVFMYDGASSTVASQDSPVAMSLLDPTPPSLSLTPSLPSIPSIPTVASPSAPASPTTPTTPRRAAEASSDAPYQKFVHAMAGIYNLSDEQLQARFQFESEIGYGNWGSVWACRLKDMPPLASPGSTLGRAAAMNGGLGAGGCVAVKLAHRGKEAVSEDTCKDDMFCG